MNIAWIDVESVLNKKKATQNEQNALRQIFNNKIFQSVLIGSFGLLTEDYLLADSSKKEVELSIGALSDLGELDTFDLIDYIECHQLTFQQASTITPQQLALLSDDLTEKVTSSLMAGLDSEHDPIRYMLSAIVQTGFPYKAVKGQQHFERKNGDLTVTMSAPNEIGLPSGMYPRLAFVHICSEIVKRQDKKINLGPSLKKFVVDEMGRPWSTGKKGTANKWKETFISLLATNFTITHKYTNSESKEEGILLNNVSIADKSHLWWDSNYHDLKGAEIEVSESFAEAILKHATPLDIRALRSLSELRSPLAFDLYCWLTYRFWKMEEKKVPLTRISWKQLYGQLGSNISTVRHFIYDVRTALKEVKKVYPQANFNADQESVLMLFSSPAHISSMRTPQQEDLMLE